MQNFLWRLEVRLMNIDSEERDALSTNFVVFTTDMKTSPCVNEVGCWFWRSTVKIPAVLTNCKQVCRVVNLAYKDTVLLYAAGAGDSAEWIRMASRVEVWGAVEGIEVPGGSKLER